MSKLPKVIVTDLLQTRRIYARVNHLCLTKSRPRTTIDLENGWTPLHYACHNDQAEIVSYILETERNILGTGGQAYRVVHQGGELGWVDFDF